MSLARTYGLCGLVSRNATYAFVSSARLRSSKGEAGMMEDRERAAENIYVRKHEEEMLKLRKKQEEEVQKLKQKQDEEKKAEAAKKSKK